MSNGARVLGFLGKSLFAAQNERRQSCIADAAGRLFAIAGYLNVKTIIFL
jgi:CRISPR/Cas system endoribonuclease Cas6 (RAMP superfamily)